MIGLLAGATPKGIVETPEPFGHQNIWSQHYDNVGIIKATKEHLRLEKEEMNHVCKWNAFDA